MIQIYNIIGILTLFTTTVCSTTSEGLFYLQRNQSYCAATTITTVSVISNASDCFFFDWNQINSSTTHYTVYMNPTTNVTYYAQLGALTVMGTIDNHNLSYQCPPDGYNGVGPGCNVTSNIQLAILHIGTVDEKLYAIDVILSGTPFPPAETLQDNQPPFGRARHIINSGIQIASSGYLQICKINNSNQCPHQNTNPTSLPYPLPSNYGYGMFGIKAYDLVTNSTWIMDDANQLLIITAGSLHYYFNASGFFYYDVQNNQCLWFDTCNYKCEVYNYNSRFLDYAGEWIITYKWGIGSITPLRVDIWIGNAIDAAGIFPIIMYMDKETGNYIGLDKLDTFGGSNMGASYWYVEHGPTIPRTSIEAFHPNVVEINCTDQLSTWASSKKSNSQATLNCRNILLWLITIHFLTSNNYLNY